MFVVAVDSAIDVYVVAAVVDASAVDSVLSSNSMDSDFERISFFRVAKRTHYEPLHNHRTQCQLQSERLLLSPASNGIV